MFDGQLARCAAGETDERAWPAYMVPIPRYAQRGPGWRSARSARLQRRQLWGLVAAACRRAGARAQATLPRWADLITDPGAEPAAAFRSAGLVNCSSLARIWLRGGAGRSRPGGARDSVPAWDRLHAFYYATTLRRCRRSPSPLRASLFNVGGEGRALIGGIGSPAGLHGASTRSRIGLDHRRRRRGWQVCSGAARAASPAISGCQARKPR